MLSNTLLSGIVFAGLSVAQSTISLYIPGADTQPLVGSVIASDATATTYALECAPGTDSDDCGFPGVFTLTEGPSTAVYTLGGDIEADSSTIVAFSGYFDCSLDASSAVCVESFTGTEANFPGMSTETFTGTDFSYMPVVITDGPLATDVAAPSSTGAAPTPASTTSAGGEAVSNTTGGKSSSGSATKTSASGSGATVTQASATSKSSSASTGGVPMVTGNAKWVLGGAALAAVLV